MWREWLRKCRTRILRGFCRLCIICCAWSTYMNARLGAVPIPDAEGISFQVAGLDLIARIVVLMPSGNNAVEMIKRRSAGRSQQKSGRRSRKLDSLSKLDSNHLKGIRRKQSHTVKGAIHHDGEHSGSGFPNSLLSTTGPHSACFGLLWRGRLALARFVS